ncbi:MAG: hypothetical protein ACRD9R_08245 [Pyrinomonadaceae bacterium]
MSLKFAGHGASVTLGLVLLSSAPLFSFATQTRTGGPPRRQSPPAEQKSQPPAPATNAPATTTTPQSEKTAKPAAKSQANILPAKPKETAGTWKLKVGVEAPYLMSLKAEKSPLSEVAGELGRKLKVPVMLSPVMQQQRVTVDFSGIPLEGALRLLAPQPYVDYELSGEPGAQPKPMGLYLYAINEPAPSDTAVVKGGTESILIEGDTEEGLAAEGGNKEKVEEPALHVTLNRNQLTLRAKKQPLTAVLYEIALKVDIPFEMKYESTELVDAEYNNYTIEQLVRSLSPNIRLYQRTDLSNYETRPLRLVLVPPASAQQTTNL